MLCLIVAAVANAYLVRPLPYPAANRHGGMVLAAGVVAGGLGAIWWPARRAAATDPAALLKTEGSGISIR